MDAEVITIFYSKQVETASTDPVNLTFEWIIDNIYLTLGICFIFVCLVWQYFYNTNPFTLFLGVIVGNINFAVKWIFAGVSLLFELIIEIFTQLFKLIFENIWLFIVILLILVWIFWLDYIIYGFW